MSNPYPIKELRVSHSSLGMFDSCARKLEHRKFMLHPGGDSSLPGEVGNALHAGYQEFLITKNFDKACAAMMLRYPITMCSTPAWGYSMEECYATLQAVCHSHYLIEYELAYVDCVDGIRRPAIEIPFSIELAGFNLKTDGHVYVDRPNFIPVYYEGFVDAFMFNKLTGEYIAVDFKTTKQDLANSIYKYKFDEQLIPYAFVLEQMLKRQVDTLKFKYLAVSVDMQNPEVRLYEFTKTRRDVQEWAQGLMHRMHNIRSFYNMVWFPRRGGNCHTYNRPCQFWDVCQYDKVEMRLRLIAMDKREQRGQKLNPWIKVQLAMAG